MLLTYIKWYVGFKAFWELSKKLHKLSEFHCKLIVSHHSNMSIVYKLYVTLQKLMSIWNNPFDVLCNEYLFANALDAFFFFLSFYWVVYSKTVGKRVFSAESSIRKRTKLPNSPAETSELGGISLQDDKDGYGIWCFGKWDEPKAIKII